MSGKLRWVIGVAAGVGALGVAATSSLLMLAHHFVEELSGPHRPLDDEYIPWTLPDPGPEPPASHRRSLLFHTTDGTLLCGDFWAQPQPAPTIVICHGYRINRTHMRPVAALEYQDGYNILLFDFRGHGESESVATSGGNAEIRDLEAALNVARQQPETLPGKIIIHGFSMGASVALLTDPQTDVAAIVLDSPYARLDEILQRIMHWQLTRSSKSWKPFLHPLRNGFHALTQATLVVSTVIFRLRFGHALNARPDTSFRRWQARSNGLIRKGYPPILLIHGMKDSAVPITHAHKIVTQAQAHNITLETYFVEDADHCGAYGYDPQQYIQVLRQFMAQHLDNDSMQGPAV
ncbi:MAG TPA: alpha/beta hydrolase [Ktedonobacteraceae bacterium]